MPTVPATTTTHGEDQARAGSGAAVGRPPVQGPAWAPGARWPIATEWSVSARAGAAELGGDRQRARRPGGPRARPGPHRPGGAGRRPRRGTRRRSTPASTPRRTRCTSATWSRSCSCAASRTSATARSSWPAGPRGWSATPGGRSDERNLLDPETLRANTEAIKVQLAQFLDFEGEAAAILVDNRDWTEGVSLLEFLAGRRQARHRQPDDGQGLGAQPPRERDRHLLHRVQLHAPPGPRLLVAAHQPRLRAPGRRVGPVGQHHRRHRPDPAQGGDDRPRPDRAPDDPQRRGQVRQEPVGQRVAGPGEDLAVPVLPVPDADGRRGRRALPAPAHPAAGRPLRGRSPPSTSRPPSAAWPSGSWPGP